MKTDYKKQGRDFLESTNTTFSTKFIEHGLHFDGDKEKRDIYEITLKRGERAYSFRFGQSIVHSGQFVIVYKSSKYARGDKLHDQAELKKARASYIGGGYGQFWDKNKDFEEPTPYCVLSCLTKYDPGTFEDFCGEFGYDTDSRKAEKVYKAVYKEYQNVRILYSDAEIEQLAKIS